MALVSKRGHPDWFLALYDLPPAKLDEALEVFAEKPEDCDAPCWRNRPDGGPCTCDDETEGGTWQPGC